MAKQLHQVPFKDIIAAFQEGVPEAFYQLSDEEKKTLLSKTDEHRNNVLLHALETSAQITFAPQYLLEALRSLNDPALSKQVLAHSNQQNLNVFMLAIWKGQSFLLPYLMTELKQLSDPDLMQALLTSKSHVKIDQRYHQHITINIMTLALNSSEEIAFAILAAELKRLPKPNILKIVLSQTCLAMVASSKLNEEKIAFLNDLADELDAHEIITSMWTETNTRGENILSTTLINQPAELSKIIDLIEGFCEPETSKHILTQANTDGENALMIAATLESSELTSLTDLIYRLNDPDMTINLLVHRNYDGRNALMIALSSELSPADNVNNIIALLQSTNDIKTIKIVLSQTDRQDYNSLMLAAHRKPETLSQIISLIKKCDDPETTKNLLCQSNSDGFNAFTIAALNNPKLIPTLLDLYSSIGEKAELLNQSLQTRTHKGKVCHIIKKQGYLPALLEKMHGALSDEVLNEYSKDDILNAIKTLMPTQQIPLLEACLNTSTSLGQRFHDKPSFFNKPAKKLKEVSALLESVKENRDLQIDRPDSDDIYPL